MQLVAVQFSCWFWSVWQLDFKTLTMTEGEDDEDDAGEVFRVPKVMAEEQHNVLGMLTQTLAQMEE